MCKLCDNLKNITKKTPLQFTGYWTDNERTATITCDLLKCSIELYDNDGNFISMPFTHCPCCGEPLVNEKITDYNETIMREG